MSHLLANNHTVLIVELCFDWIKRLNLYIVGLINNNANPPRIMSEKRGK